MVVVTEVWETNVMIALSVAIWKHMGFLLVHNYRRYAYLFPNFVLNTSQLLAMITTDSLSDRILNAYFFVLYFNCITRVVVAISHRRKFENYLKKFVRLYDEMHKYGDQTMRDILDTYSYQAKIFARMNLFLGTFSSVCFVIYPLFAGKRDLPYGVFIPGVDYKAYPIYEILFTLQGIVTFTGCGLYIPFSNLFTSFIMLGIVMIKILRYKLETVMEPKGTTEYDVKRRIKWCISFHKIIIDYVAEMNELVSLVCLIELVLFGLLLCALLFLINIVTLLAQIIMGSCYILLIMVQLFTLYWNANELMVESTLINLSIYKSPWYTLSKSNKKLLLIMMIRLQKPMQVMIGEFFPITLKMFQSVLNAAYSYFTILRRVYK